MASALRKSWQLAKAKADQAYKKVNAPFLLNVPPTPLPYPKFNKNLGPTLDKLDKAKEKDQEKLKSKARLIVAAYLKEVDEGECNNTAGTDKIMKFLKKELKSLRKELE